jgi:hypothetical protein
MDYYIGVMSLSELGEFGPVTTFSQIWKVENNRATRIDVSPSPLNNHVAGPGEDILTSLQEGYPAYTFRKLELKPGEYYPRMVRPYSSHPTETLGYNPNEEKAVLYARVRSTGQLHTLIGQLQQICQVIHPEGDNLKTFGHGIRNFLILAATEVEAQWKQILEANGKKGGTTSDYVKLSVPLKLPEFAVDFPWYPWLDPIKPFDNWGTGNAHTQSLPWYAAYNSVKHDREKNFAQSSLLNAFQAISGCFVLLCAQYGWDFARRDDKATNEFLRLLGAPKWELSEVYVLPFGTGTWTPKPYPFGT